jgi:hypothetical protein
MMSIPLPFDIIKIPVVLIVFKYVPSIKKKNQTIEFIPKQNAYCSPAFRIRTKQYIYIFFLIYSNHH